MTRGLIVAFLLLGTMYTASAQHYYRERPREEPRYTDDQTYGDGFKKKHLFIGGNIGLGYDGYTFNAGISPELGYSFTHWLDAGALVNLNYSSERPDPYFNYDTRIRSFNYGTGVFVRAYALPFLYFTASPEYNWVHYSLTDFNDPSHPSTSETTGAASLLLGVGYGQRIVGRSSMHLALMFDVLNNAQSPYRDYTGRVIPVLKAGFDIYFHPKKQYTSGQGTSSRL